MKQTKPSTDSRHANWRAIKLIMLALVIWGAFHATGAFLFGMGFWDILKAVIVYVFMAAFLGFWALMLSLREHRLRREQESSSRSK